ncbi:MAG: DUF4381 domain-containing protein [Sulfurovum sp.]|nr:DUF4381 domain-containing protein [Sulfurovaceae bacterium]
MSIDMNVTIAQASLNNMHDIIIPDAIGIFPLASGMVIILLLSITLLFHFMVVAYTHYIDTQYKRDALAELERVNYPSRANFLILLSLAKRVGICVYGRNKVAPLSGKLWWTFIQEHSKAKIDDTLEIEIYRFLYDDKKVVSDKSFQAIFSFVKSWIETHKINKVASNV